VAESLRAPIAEVDRNAHENAATRPDLAAGS
jgi:hypothetical protein